jgi:hypothetical protein
MQGAHRVLRCALFLIRIGTGNRNLAGESPTMKNPDISRISSLESRQCTLIGSAIAVLWFFSLKKILFFPFRETRFIFAPGGLRMDPGLPGILQVTPFLRKT